VKLLVSKDNGNVIIFPTNKIVRKTKISPPKDEKLLKKLKDQQTKQFVETSVDDISMGLLRQFYDMAIKTGNHNFTKDFALLVDVMRGLIYRDFGIKHPAQMLSDKLVELKVTKDATQSARIDYMKILEAKHKVHNPLSKELKEELKELKDQADSLFEGDDIND
jgi:hypothetical protein